jgi:hypothetical protein
LRAILLCMGLFSRFCVWPLQSIRIGGAGADGLSLQPLALNILVLRGEIAELGGAIQQLQRSGLDSTSAQLLVIRKRAELECLMNRGSEHRETLKR